MADLIRLRYQATCRRCGGSIAVGDQAEWDRVARAATCEPCVATVSNEAREPPPDATGAPPTGPTVVGSAGASARREFERRRDARDARIDARWGRVAPVIKAVTFEPGSTIAWNTGARGESELGQRLEGSIRPPAVILHDRRIPPGRANIDHIVVAPSGVWVIDAKRYSGKVERRDVGGWFRTDVRLFVGGRDRHALVNGALKQVLAVRGCVDPGVPTHAALCFVGAEWPLWKAGGDIGGVWCVWPKRLIQLITAGEPTPSFDIDAVGARLAAALRPAAKN